MELYPLRFFYHYAYAFYSFYLANDLNHNFCSCYAMIFLLSSLIFYSKNIPDFVETLYNRLLILYMLK